ncbi:MAG: NmrA family protein [Myxococcaceae bacterium]|nr:NmrA family protein [Myxococcaceae bacterium]
MNPSIIVVAGATGNLGGRIVKALLARGAVVRALVRRESDPAGVAALKALGVEAIEVEPTSVASVAAACRGADCAVSAVLGLRDVMVDAQKVLLDGAIAAGVPRFIPSDYCLDFTKLRDGENRNLDLHREFQRYLDTRPIAATSILNGAFADMLTGKAPLILFRYHRVLYWENPDQTLDFTTIDDTAAFTAAAALDPTTPRFLKIAGESITARGLAAVMTALSGKEYRLLRAGGLRLLATLIKVGRALMPAPGVVFPPWQGMQYLHNMFGGRAVLAPLDNDRYPDLRWTPVRDVLAARS